jgi:tRNA threonylcarbamoyladenosine biosynthesis protein TsaE
MVERNHDRTEGSLTLFLADDDATERVGAALGLALRPGDAVMLEGDLGAGKSALARAALRALLAEDGRAEDIPSPTFTLVQAYETARSEVWHVDLYRLSSPEEALELGLDAAFGQAITLVEWPDRLGDLAPARRLNARLDLPKNGEGRVLTLTAIGEDWARALDAVREAA